MSTKYIYNSIERLGELLKVSARQAVADYGLQPIHLEVLHYLSACNGFSDTPMAVTEYLGQTKGTVSQSIKVLEKNAFIRKESDLNDKRISHLKVTPSGLELINETLPTQLFQNACDSLGDKEREDISSALQTLLASVFKANQIKSFGVCHTCKYHRKIDEGEFFCELVNVPIPKSDIALICREHDTKK